MIHSRIIIQGKLEKEPKVNEDGTADLILTNEIENNANSNIKIMGKSLFLVKINKGLYEENKDRLHNLGLIVSIIGYVKVLKNKKGIPYIYVSANTVNVYGENSKKNKGMRLALLRNDPTILSNVNDDIVSKKTKKTKEIKRWWSLLNEQDFTVLQSDKIVVTEEVHQKGKMTIDISEKIEQGLYVAVKKMDDGCYSLVSGLKALMIAKTLDLDVKAYITEKSIDEFVNVFEIV